MKLENLHGMVLDVECRIPMITTVRGLSTDSAFRGAPLQRAGARPPACFSGHIALPGPLIWSFAHQRVASRCEAVFQVS